MVVLDSLIADNNNVVTVGYSTFRAVMVDLASQKYLLII